MWYDLLFSPHSIQNREQDVVTAKKRKKVVKKKRGKVWLNSQRFDGGVTKGVMRIRERTD